MEMIIYVAVLLFEKNMITIGQISMFLFYLLLLVMMFVMLSRVLGNIVAILGAVDKLDQIIKLKPKVDITVSGIKIDDDQDV